MGLFTLHAEGWSHSRQLFVFVPTQSVFSHSMFFFIIIYAGKLKDSYCFVVLLLMLRLCGYCGFFLNAPRFVLGCF